MKKLFLIALVILCLSPILVYSAGSSVIQTPKIINDINSTLSLSWTSDDATGAVSAAISAENMAFVLGKWITKVRCVPSQGAAKPTTLYDVTIKDSNGLDVMGGSLEDRTIVAGGDQALPYVGNAYGPTQVVDSLTLNVTNAGNSKTGIVILDLSR